MTLLIVIHHFGKIFGGKFGDVLDIFEGKLSELYASIIVLHLFLSHFCHFNLSVVNHIVIIIPLGFFSSKIPHVTFI